MDKFYRNRCIVNLCQTSQLTQEEIAQTMELSQGRISQLYHQFQREGESGLVVKRAPGTPPKLTSEQRAQLPELLSKGAEHYGFEGAVWTSARVGEVIQQHFGVTYEVSSMGFILKELGLTLQPPKRHDYRQNPPRVAEWQAKTLPELKNPAVAENRRIFYLDESAFDWLPQTGPTWSPAGQTPVLREGCQSAHLSVISAISSQGHIYYQFQRTSYTGSDIVKFIRDLCHLNS